MPPNIKELINGEKRKKLLHLAQTAQFEVKIKLPGDVEKFIKKKYTKVVAKEGFKDISLLCNEATLPGSSLATHDITSDIQGVSEKIPYRRIYDQELSLTFYVDHNYDIIKIFDGWLDYISGVFAKGPDNNYYSPYAGMRQRYPNDYRKDLFVTKFERDIEGPKKRTVSLEKNKRSILSYRFLHAYPVRFQAIPVSYAPSDVLRCTVGFSYTRHMKEIIDIKAREVK